jgi:hypothetical protein
MFCFPASLASIFAIAISVFTLAQDRETFLDDFPLAPYRFAEIELKGGIKDPNDDEFQEWATLVHRPPRIDEIFLLNKEWVQDELSLTFTQAQHFRDEYKRILNQRTPVPDNLLELLDAKQREKFLDVRIRSRIRSMGILDFLSRPQLGLPQDELADMRELLTALEPIYTQRIAELRDKTLHKLRDVLTKEQQQTLDGWSLGFLESRLPSLDLLVWQMKNLEFFAETIADERLPKMRGFFIGGIFFLDYDGNLESEPFIGRPIDLKAKVSARELKVREAYINQQVFLSLHRIITDESLSKEIQSTSEQIELAKSLVDRFAIFESHWHETIYPILSSRDQDRSEVYAEYQRLKAELIADSTRDLENILMPHQTKLLETMSLLIEVLKAGYPGAFVSGGTGKALKLTVDQKNAIEEICQKSISEIESQTRKWENEIFSRLNDTLSKERREGLKFLIECPISHGHVNIYLLLNGGR